jgi:probable phosphoglycerate mutase
MVKVLFTRHGQTVRNVKGVIQGPTHGDLNEKGFEQIEKLIKRLKVEKVDIIISSDIPRANITSEKVGSFYKIPLEYDKNLREKDNGVWEGKNINEVKWDDLEGNFETRKAPEGENLLEVRERARIFLKKLLKKYKGTDKTILVVTHGAFLKILIGDLMGTSIKDSIFKLFIDHCSLTRVDFDKSYHEGYQIKYVNDNEFLGDSRNWVLHK